MHFLTPTLLLFVPVWAASYWLRAGVHVTVAAQSTPDHTAQAQESDDLARWVGMPFVPPTVHVA